MHSLTFRHFFIVCEFGNTEICIHLLKFSDFYSFIGLFWFLIIRGRFCSRSDTIFFSVTMADKGTISDSDSSLDSKGLSSAERQYLDMVEKGAFDSLQNLSISSSSSSSSSQDINVGKLSIKTRKNKTESNAKIAELVGSVVETEEEDEIDESKLDSLFVWLSIDVACSRWSHSGAVCDQILRDFL